MIDVLLLGRQYGYALLQEALEQALDLSCFDVEAVRLLLTTERSGKLSKSVPCEPMTARNQTDFGLVAMVTAVTVIAAGFADLGLTEATIERRELTGVIRGIAVRRSPRRLFRPWSPRSSQ